MGPLGTGVHVRVSVLMYSGSYLVSVTASGVVSLVASVHSAGWLTSCSKGHHSGAVMSGPGTSALTASNNECDSINGFDGTDAFDSGSWVSSEIRGSDSING